MQWSFVLCSLVRCTESFHHYCQAHRIISIFQGVFDFCVYITLYYFFSEAKRAGLAEEEAAQLGVVTSHAVTELTMFQHLHYFHHNNTNSGNTNDDGGGCGGCGGGGGGGSNDWITASGSTNSTSNYTGSPYFIQPVGVLSFPAVQLNRNHHLRSVLLGGGSGGGGDGTAGNSNASLKAPAVHGAAGYAAITSLYGDSAASVAKEVPLVSPKLELQYLAFPPVQLSLGTILGLNCSPHSSARFPIIKSHLEGTHPYIIRILQQNAGHLLAPSFAVELCRDLLCATQHLVSR